MKRITVTAAALAVAGAGMIAIPATAQAATTPCSGDSMTFCLGPVNDTLSTASPNCTPFADGQEWQSFDDANGVSQLWTYSNGSNACIQINYYPQVESGYNCYYYFYVPDNGYANGKITFGWWDTSGAKHYAAPVDESTSPSTGWVQLDMGPGGFLGGASNVTRISFQDNNGQTPGSTYLGWGDSNIYGIQEVC